jgi:hypothetical protein
LNASLLPEGADIPAAKAREAVNRTGKRKTPKKNSAWTGAPDVGDSV